MHVEDVEVARRVDVRGVRVHVAHVEIADPDVVEPGSPDAGTNSGRRGSHISCARPRRTASAAANMMARPTGVSSRQARRRRGPSPRVDLKGAPGASEVIRRRRNTGLVRLIGPCGRGGRKVGVPMQRLASLSCFFPAYNEEPNMARLLDEVVARSRSSPTSGRPSSSTTAPPTAPPSIVRDYAARHPEIRLVQHKNNLGYGHALQTGLKESTGQAVFFTDADLQFHLSDIGQLLAAVRERRRGHRLPDQAPGPLAPPGRRRRVPHRAAHDVRPPRARYRLRLQALRPPGGRRARRRARVALGIHLAGARDPGRRSPASASPRWA